MQTPENSLSHYLAELRRYPMLTLEQEEDLSRRWRDHGDKEAVRLLAGSHLRFVVKIAKSYRGYGLPFTDLISEGNVGLMKALEKFDPERGVRLATYAQWWIKATIQEYVLKSWSLVKIGTTGAQKKLFFNLRKMKAQLELLEEGDLPHEQVEAIARDLDVSEDEVVAMNRRLAGPDHSLNAPLRADGDGDAEWQDWLVDDSESPEALLVVSDEADKRRALLNRAMEELNERERHILMERRLRDEPVTLEVLSQQYGISRERVRQIEVRAFEKVQDATLQAALAQNQGPLQVAA
jgi:RNA polymerase sigma-32 factor